MGRSVAETRYCGSLRVDMKRNRSRGVFTCKVSLDGKLRHARDEVLGYVDVRADDPHPVAVASKAVAFAVERGPSVWGEDIAADAAEFDSENHGYVIRSDR